MGESIIKEASAPELAEVLGVTDRRIRQLADAGVVVKVGHGKYDIAASVQGYMRAEREALIAKLTSTTAEDLDKHRARLFKAKADAAEEELALRRGKVVDVECMADLIVEIFTAIKTKALALPATLSPRVLGMETTAEINTEITTEVYNVLTELTRFRPEAVVERYLEKESLVRLGADDGGADAAAEADGERVG